MAKRGRPTKYTKKLADKICAQLANGDSMRTVCKPTTMPCKATLFRWLRTKSEFLDQYEKAKAESADALVDEILDIADDGSNDWMETHDKEGENIGWKTNGEAMQRSRLRVDTRKWIASKLKPKKYGDRVFNETTHKGIIGMRDVSDMSKEDIEAELAQLDRENKQ